MKNITRNFLLIIFFMMFSTPVLFAQDGFGVSSFKANGVIWTITALVLITPFVTELLKKLLGKTTVTPNFAVQLTSWVTGILITFIARLIGIGFLAGLGWFTALLCGLLISLAANGVADTKIISWIFSIFKKKN